MFTTVSLSASRNLIWHMLTKQKVGNSAALIRK
jgi:hypothetical protein